MDMQRASLAGQDAGAPRRVRVWDPWVRLTHWGIALLLPLSWWSAETGRLDLHFLSGYAMLALVLFRLAWGFMGSETARFGRFLRGPAAAAAHLRHFLRRETPWDIGHNAAGGWMAALLLVLLLVQAGSGLFADDLVMNRGPLARRVGEAWSGLATTLHLRVFWVILGCAVLHVLAIGAYRVLLRRDLVTPMLTGTVELPPGVPAAAPRMASPALAVLLLAACSGFVWWLSTLRPPGLF